jgi:hypothetical protein
VVHGLAPISGTYVVRSNITLDRTFYYTTEMHYTDEVKYADAASFNIEPAIVIKD